MTQQSGSSYVEATADSQDSGYQTDAERFPDPKRNWKRTGTLLGGWVMSLVAVFVFGILWHNVLAGVAQTNPAEDAVSERSSARLLINAIYKSKSLEEAEPQLCTEYEGPDVGDLVDEARDSGGRFKIDLEGHATPIRASIRAMRTDIFQVREFQIYSDGSCVYDLEYTDTSR